MMLGRLAASAAADCATAALAVRGRRGLAGPRFSFRAGRSPEAAHPLMQTIGASVATFRARPAACAESTTAAVSL